MPHKSVKAAEKAAIEGEVEDWDTQQCEALREELLPSSPNRNRASQQVASASTRVATLSSPLRLKVERPEPEVESEDELEPNTHVVLSLPVGDGGIGPRDLLLQPTNIENDLIVPIPNALRFSQTVQIRRDHLGRLRPFRTTGDDDEPAPVINKDQSQAQVLPTMDDSTQRSSMSATQENPPHLYERFNQFDIQAELRNNNPATVMRADGDSEDPRILPDPRHASASTGYTYQENDTGHIHLGFDSEPVEEDEYMEESQDASYAMPAIQNSASLEPKTPAPPKNPFQQKGSVMKVFELFGATQPSSIGRHMASPTSSRPSPDVYNYFSSPPKRHAPVLSSPLGRGPAPELVFEANDATPLQSSVRNILARSQSGDSKIAHSFDTGPKRAWTNPEPRPYVSMRDSQEKRRQAKDPDPESSGDDFDIEATPRNHKFKRELNIQREIGTVGLRKGASTNPRSSAPPSSTNAVDIEVPSTGRRRSIQDDYIAQCIGHDARDTQQDDVIVDSQSEAPDNEKANDDPDSSRLPTTEEKQQEEQEDRNIDEDATQQTNSSQPEPSMDQEPSLPLQQVSSNRSTVRTPSSKPATDTPVDTVPETSPPEDRLRPMAEIASISFGASEVLPDNLPGFTQDVEFDSAMQIRSSPRPPARIRSLGRGPSSSSVTSSRLTTPVIKTAIFSVTSSALSSPPNSAVLQEVEAEVTRQAAEEASPVIEDTEAATDVGESRKLNGADQTDGPVETSAAVALADPELGVSTAPEDTSALTEKSNVELKDAEIEVELEAEAEAANDTTTTASPKEKPVTKSPPKRPLRTYSKLKGPAARERPVNTPAAATPRQSSRVAKLTPAPRATQTPKSTPRSTPLESKPSTVRKVTLPKQRTPQPEPAIDAPSASAVPNKRTSKRKSGVTVVHDDALPTRTSKRQSTAKESSPDPLALSSPAAVGRSPKSTTGLFKDMTFAVSFVNHEREKDGVTKAIFEHGGRILQDGFDSLFESAKGLEDMALCTSAKSVGFVALIADEHSRKAKYMQALALGIPCISGRWITACVVRNSVIDWSPYLLCAGQSSILGNAHKSRVLQPYPATGAKFEDTFANRDKLLEGKSVLLITGKGKLQEKRKAYTFLAHALGPLRISQVADYQDARKKLSQEDGQAWDLLYVDAHEKTAEEEVFGTPVPVSSSAASRKRKRGPTAAIADDSPAPKKIRIISDETMIQSLILGQLLDD